MNRAWNELLRPGDASDFFSWNPVPRFEPFDTAFRLENAAWMAELSRLVYRHDREEDNPPPIPRRAEFLARAGLQQRAFFLSRETDTQALLVETQSPPFFAALAFRGTEQKIKDFATDLEMGTQPMKGDRMCVHEGFQSAIDSVWEEIAESLSRLTCPVFYTGHSLGAALATLAAGRRAPNAVYTFGSPMVGNEEFVRSLDATPIHRVVDGDDIIATLPPEALGFRHAGNVYRLPEPPSSKALFPSRILPWLCSPPKPFADHAPINYLRGILRQLQKTATQY